MLSLSLSIRLATRNLFTSVGITFRNLVSGTDKLTDGTNDLTTD